MTPPADASATDPRPLLAGVMGWPIGHSKSPLIFAHWFARHQVPGAYVRLAVRPEDFGEVLRVLPKAGFRGVNVTIPHKLSALELADEASDAARAIGAANTLVFTPEGRIRADNTDAFGFLENLREGAPAWDPQAGPALVLGAGGAARAVVHALIAAGVPRIRLANRTRQKAEALGGPHVEVHDWEARAAALAGAALVVNTTSLGMEGQPPLDLPLDRAGPETVVADLVYAPLITPLLAEARARGLTPVDGLGMLLHQARPGFLAWFGHDAVVDPELRRVVLAGVP